MIINQVIQKLGTVIDSGDIYVAGADKNDDSYTWITPAAAWTLSSLVTPATNRNASLGFWNNKLYVIWPLDSSAGFNAVYRYDFTTETWTTLTGMSFWSKRGQFYQVGSKVYMHIGLSSGNMNTLAHYDCATETFTTILTSSWVGSVYTQAGNDDETIYLGYGNYLYKYVISTAALSQVSTTALGGTSYSSLLYQGGYIYFRYGSVFKRYDIALGTWTTLHNLTSGTSVIYDMILRGGIIYFISQLSISTTYQYDINANVMTSWNTNNKAYASHIIANNVMYEVGGMSGSTLYNTIYTFSFSGTYAAVSKYVGLLIKQADNLDLTVGAAMPAQLPYPTDTTLPFRLKLQMDAIVTDTIN